MPVKTNIEKLSVLNSPSPQYSAVWYLSQERKEIHKDKWLYRMNENEMMQ